VRLSYEGRVKRFAATRVDDATWRTEGGKDIAAADAYALLVALLEAETSGFSADAPQGSPVANFTYRLGSGASGRIDFYDGGRATWDALPGVAFTLGGPLPAVPDQK